LLLAYDAAKPIPLAGNLVHGALIANAALIGGAAVGRTSACSRRSNPPGSSR
jgi:4-hydroxybenzoate polyprenyltransferase